MNAQITRSQREAALHDAGKDTEGKDLPAGANTAELRDQKLEKARLLIEKAVKKYSEAQTRRSKRASK